MKFEEKLIKLRKENALSQEELGEKLNVTRQTISKWELGQTRPDSEKIAEISKIFNVSIDELLNESEENVISNSQKVENSEKKDKRNTIIVIVLIIVLLAVLVYVISGIIFKNKSVDIINKIFGQNTAQKNDANTDIKDKTYEIIDNIQNNIQEGINEYKNSSENKNNSSQNNQKNNMSEFYNTLQKEYEDGMAEINNKSEVDGYNNKYKNLFTGVQEKFFVERAIKNVIEDNINNKRKMKVKYKNNTYIETKELTSLISKLNKKEYIITYDYGEDGYISQMNISEN